MPVPAERAERRAPNANANVKRKSCMIYHNADIRS
jgi:hypothetical protein